MEKYRFRRWTKEEDRTLKKLYQKKTLFELANIFDRHWNKVCRRALLLGIKKDKVVFGKEISKTQKKQFKEGKRSNKGDKNPNWRGGITKKYAGIEQVKYSSVHWWLRKNFGVASKCENPNCKNLSKNYEWAKRKEKNYEKKIDNFIMLCKSCHARQDIKPKNLC